MNTQTIQLDISIDIFDRVVKFLKTLPKNKIKLKIEDNIIFKKKGIITNTSKFFYE